MTGFERTRLEIDVLTFTPWAEAGVPHGFSFRRRRVEGDEPFGARDRENHRDLARALELDAVVTMRQVHGSEVLRVAQDEKEPTCDGLVTSDKGLALVVQTADCVPLLLWDPARRTAGAVHAGWRGTLAGVTRVAIERLTAEPGSVEAVIGPSIGACCYEVGDDVVENFARRFEDAETLFHPGPRGRAHLDLIEANRRQLVEAGVPREKVHASGHCTSCERALFYSFRREGPGVGRLFAAIGIR